MRKLALAALMPLALASCGIFGTPTNYNVSGTISGSAPAGTVKLAVVGVSTSGVVNADVAQIAVNTFDGKKFSVDYPSNPSDGVYQVIAYVDSNGNGKYDVGETKTQNNNKYLVYLKNGGTLESWLGLKAGWNYVVGTNVSQSNHITDYDLNW